VPQLLARDVIGRWPGCFECPTSVDSRPMGIHDDIGPRIAALLAQGRRHLERNEYADAEHCYALVLEADDSRWEGYLGLAHASFALGRPADALRFAPEAIRRSPQCLPAYQIMATLGIRGGVADRAIELLEFGAQHMPLEPQMFEWLVILYATTGRDNDLRNCVVHYARLRQLSVPETVLLFSRAPDLAEDIRSRIAASARGLP
jgi:tetratricopeptide (TPR) repeat protein